VGVFQALNKKQGPFGDEDVELLMALGAQAAGAVENAILTAEISRLFEGFVSASISAIESRDPSTAGHSTRVAELTLTLAKMLTHVEKGPYARVGFSAPELQEIRYASLLHDFGKVGVREHVLVKAEKLYPHELEALKLRFALARKDRQLKSALRRIQVLGARRWSWRRPRTRRSPKACASSTRSGSSSSPATAPPCSRAADSSGWASCRP
jgi:hypothetical protein